VKTTHKLDSYHTLVACSQWLW